MTILPDNRVAAFTAGLAHHRAGRLREAAQCYQQALHHAPGHAQAWHLLGLISAQTGDTDRALIQIERAVAIAPDLAEAHYNLGNIHRQAGRLDAACAAWRTAIAAATIATKVSPDHAFQAKVHGNLGATLRVLGDIPGAIDACRRAVQLAPDSVAAQYNLGCVLHHAGQIDEAVSVYRTVVQRQPDHADAQSNLGQALLKLGHSDQALVALQAAHSLAPGPETAVALGDCLLRLGAFAQALTVANYAMRIAPECAAAWHLSGQVHRESGQGASALAAFARAHALDPANADTVVAMAMTMQEQGDPAAATDLTTRALALAPGHAAAWTVRAGLKKFVADDPDIAQLAALAASLERQGDHGDDLIHIEFALAKALMDCAAPSHAFPVLARANARRRASIAYDGGADLAAMAALADRFTGTARRAGDPALRPIFVVGLPRSGTTLLEQILASHPAIHGGGEMQHLDMVLLDHFGGPAPPVAAARRLSSLSPAECDRLARAYHARATRDAPENLRVTDKMPSNFRHAGLIHQMFPGAVIVNCRRDLRDTCLSIFATHFARGQHFAYDLAELGAYARGYETLTAHWRAVLPPTMWIDVDYEAVVADLEGQARRIYAACGLQWDAACLAFHRTQRPVRTASVNQVRQPLYSSSVGRWRAYAEFLVPLGL